MRIVPKPTISSAKVYSKCLNSIEDTARRSMFRKVKHHIINESINYDSKGLVATLYTIPIHVNVNGIVSKNDMKTLYNQQMVKNKKGRKIYNELLALAPLDRCPFCGIGTVSTLDHYLPKTKFPTFSVLPYNLVPSCKDCNTGKSTNTATTARKQTLHPYYDNFTEEQWLFAEVLQTSPVSVRFFVDAPTDWSSISKDRVEAHFTDYKLDERFPIEASNELANLREGFMMFPLKKRQIKKQLQKAARTHKSRYLNAWESALYQALAESNWYCDGGYNN